MQRRRAALRFVAAEKFKVVHAVGDAGLAQRFEPRYIVIARGYHQLAASPVRQMAFGAIVVEQRLAVHAQLRLQAAARAIEAGVNHLAVARRHVGADGRCLLDDHHLAPRSGQRACHRQAHDAGADDDALNAVQP